MSRCLEGTTSSAGGLCYPCPEGFGDTSSITGQCSPCPLGSSSSFGAACLPCAAGYSTNSIGGPCEACAAGSSSIAAGSCTRCAAGQSSVAGGPCLDCAAGYFSYSGGVCLQCNPGFSSVAGSTACFKCPEGQDSNSGGVCFDRCAGGHYWNIGAKACYDCPRGTFANSGATQCQSCPRTTYSSLKSAFCFPLGLIGSIMRVNTPYQLSDIEIFRRQVASLTNASFGDVLVIGTTPGSTIYYFTIGGPQGNQKSIYLYDQYLSRSDGFSTVGMPAILSYQIIASEDKDSDIGLTLYVDQRDPSPIVQPQPPASANFVKEVYSDLNTATALSSPLFLLSAILFCLVIQLLIQ